MEQQREQWDIYDSTGTATGRTAVRGEKLAPGEHHLVVHIWLRDPAGRYIIQKRADHVEWVPGKWATTGGSVVAGEDSLTAAVRETEEELGLAIAPHSMKLLKRLVRHDDIADIYTAPIDADALSRCCLEHAVAEVKWATVSEVRAMVTAGIFHDYGSDYFDLLD